MDFSKILVFSYVNQIITFMYENDYVCELKKISISRFDYGNHAKIFLS
jgi:hypothetical protein